MNQAYDQDVLHLSLLYPYSNQVLANGRGWWTAYAWPKWVLR